MKQRFRPIFFATVFLTAISVLSHAGTLPVPFFPGEKLAFRVKWSFIPAGEVLLEILPMETLNGIESYHFTMTARTYAYIDPFYMVRDRIDAYTDAALTHTILYEKEQYGKSKRKVTVQFDWEKNEAQYAEIEEKRDAKLQIWVSADRWRIPVRIRSQVAVGSFVAELVSFEQGEAINKE